MKCVPDISVKNFINEINKDSEFKSRFIEDFHFNLDADSDRKVFEEFVRWFLSDNSNDGKTLTLNDFKSFVAKTLYTDDNQVNTRTFEKDKVYDDKNSVDALFSANGLKEETLRKAFCVFKVNGDFEDGSFYAIPKKVPEKQSETETRLREIVEKIKVVRKGNSGFSTIVVDGETVHGVKSYSVSDVLDDYVEYKEKLGSVFNSIKNIYNNSILGTFTDNTDKREQIEKVFKEKRNKDICDGIKSTYKLSNDDEVFDKIAEITSLFNDFPILAAPIGNAVDKVGRLFFDSNSNSIHGIESTINEVIGNEIRDLTEDEIDGILEDENDALDNIIESNKELRILSNKALLNLISDFNKIKKSMPGYRFISDLGYIASKLGNGKRGIHGEVDLIAIAPNGKIKIIDFKSNKLKITGDKLIQNEREKEDNGRYKRQVEMYIAILSSYGFDVDSEPMVIFANTSYDGHFNTKRKNALNENEKPYRYNSETGTYECGINKENGTYESYKPLNEVEYDVNDILKANKRMPEVLYLHPRVYFNEKGEGVFVANGKGNNDAKDKITGYVVTTDDNSNMAVKYRATDVVASIKSDIYSQPNIINKTELEQLANDFAVKVSEIIDIIKGNPIGSVDVNEYNDIRLALRKGLFGEKSGVLIDSTKTDSILRLIGNGDVNFGLNKLMDFLFFKGKKEDGDIDFGVFVKYSQSDINGETDEDDRSIMIANNFIIEHKDEFIDIVRSNLSKNMKIRLKVNADGLYNKFAKGESIEKSEDDEDSSDESDYLPKELEENTEAVKDGLDDKEAYMTGEMLTSTEESMSEELRNIFSKFKKLKRNARGKVVSSRNRFGVNEYLNPSEAIGQFNLICSHLSTIGEMKEAIKNAINDNDENLWMQQLLDLMDNTTGNIGDTIKRHFFRHFRKDAKRLSVTRLRYKKNDDGNTSPVFETYIINQRTARDIIINSMKTLINTGESDALLGDDGIINNDAISDSIDALDSIRKIIKDIEGSRSTSIDDKIKEIKDKLSKDDNDLLRKISKALENIGILVTDDVIINTICKRRGKGLSGRVLISKIKEVYSAIRNSNTNKTTKKSLGKRLDEIDLFKGSNYKVINNLIEFISDQIKAHVEENSYNNGKTYYTYANPSYLGKLVRHLKDEGQFISNEDKTAFSGYSRHGEGFEFEDWVVDHFLKYKGWFSRSTDSFHDLGDETSGESPIVMNYILKNLLDAKTGADYRENFDHKIQINFLGDEYKGYDSTTMYLSMLTEFEGDSRNDEKGWGWFALPTMSNKTSFEFLRLKKFERVRNSKKNATEETEELRSALEGIDGYGFDEFSDSELHSMNDMIETMIESSLKDVFEQECNRIVDVLQTAEKNSPNSPRTKKFDISEKILNAKDDKKDFKERIRKRAITVDDLAFLANEECGARFFFLPFLNASGDHRQVIVDIINGILKGDDKADVITTGRNNIKKYIRSGFIKTIVSEIDAAMKSDGINLLAEDSSSEGKTKYRYLDKLGVEVKSKGEVNRGASIKKLINKLFDFESNSIVMNINIIQLTGIDLAYYGTPVEYQKRIAQIHSPGLELCYDKETDMAFCDGKFRSVHVGSLVLNKSLLLENIEKAIRSNPIYKITNEMTSEEKKVIEDQIKVIMSFFENIDITDGQSLNCPSSIRKKLKLTGEWNSKLESAYNAVKNGNFNFNNIGAIINPSKPFVYAQTSKYSGTDGFEYRATPLQDKNSEYLILLAEAMLSSSNTENFFTKAYDFMESTHWSAYDFENHKPADGATFLNNGIDTLHFDSVAKVGLGGIIDLEKPRDKNQSYSDYMKSIVSVLDNTKEIMDFDGNQIRYNDKYVDEFNVDEYLEQQIVPTHLVDHYQLYGSQTRVLGVSDIPLGTAMGIVNGKNYTEEMTKEYIDDYKSLLAGNIDDATKQLRIELGLDSSSDETVASKNKKKIKLYELLKNDIENDPRASSDLKEAIELIPDSNGLLQFRRPLEDPLLSNRVQTLINSIVKKRINKQTIKGGPAVQVTCADNDLHIVFKDKNNPGENLKTREEFGGSDEDYKKYVDENQGGIAYYEAIMSVPDSYFEALITRSNKPAEGIRKNSYYSISEIEAEIAKISNPDERDNAKRMLDNMLSAIGYRIPTEDKYSMIPIKIVGFVPKMSGQVVMLPKEITALTGSDFDIDKLFVMFKEYKKAGFKNKNLSKETIKQMVIDIYGEDAANEFDENDYIMAAACVRNNNFSQIKEKIRFAILFKSIDFYSDDESLEGKSTKQRKAIRNNKAFNMLNAVLTHEDTTAKQLNPGNFDTQKKIGNSIKFVKRLSGNPNIDPDKAYEAYEIFKDNNESASVDLDANSIILNSSKIYFQKQNMQGSQMVGIFANNNVSHAVVSQLYESEDGGVYFSSPRKFVLFGQQISDQKGENVLDSLRGFDGLLISKVTASYVAASVDTAKTPCLADLNINTMNGDVAMTMTRMGFNIEQVGLLFSQPIIVELTNKYFANSSGGNFYNIKMAIRDIIKERTKLTEDEEIDDLIGKLDKKMEGESISSSMFTEENMVKEIFAEGSVTGNVEDDLENDFQLLCLRMFETMYDISLDVNGLTYCTKFNSIRNAAGPTIADSEDKVTRVENFLNDVASGKTIFDEKSSPVLDIFEEDKLVGAFYRNTLDPENGIVREIFENEFVDYSDGFQAVLSDLKNNYLKSHKVNASTYNDLIEAFCLYLLTYNDNEDSNLKQVIPTYIDKDGNTDEADYFVKDIVKRHKELSNNPNVKNMLLNGGIVNSIVYIRAKDDAINFDTLVFKTSGLDKKTEDAIRNAWVDLMTSNSKIAANEEERKLNEKLSAFGQDLFIYTLMRNGFGFSPKTLMHLASTFVVLNAQASSNEPGKYGSYINGIKSLRQRSEKMATFDHSKLITRFIDQFMQNNMDNRSIIPSATNDINAQVNSPIGGERTLTIHDNLDPYIVNYSSDADVEEKFVKYVVYAINGHNVLFKLDGSDDDAIYYTEVPRLGIKHNFVEYNANNDLDKSYFDISEDEDEEDFEDDKDSNVVNTKEESSSDSADAKGKMLKRVKNLIKNADATYLTSTENNALIRSIVYGGNGKDLIDAIKDRGDETITAILNKFCV